jgi:alanyl aminopeptidase
MTLTKLPGCPSWLLANDGANGYYRPAYGGDLLDKLLAAAPRHLSAAEKVGLVGDARALSSSGAVSIGEALALVGVFAKEDDRFVVGSLAQLVGTIKDRGLPPAELPAFGRFVGKTFGARARALGLVPRPGDDDDTRLLRTSLAGLVAIDGRDGSLRKEALALARKWLRDRNAVDADLVPVVLGIAADAGDASLFDAFLAAARNEKERRQRVTLLQVLGSFPDAKLAARALELALSPEFDARDTTGIYWSELSDERTRGQAFAFVKARWDELVARLPQQMRGYLPYLGASFCDDARRAEVEAFFTPRVKGFEGAPRNLAQALEGIRVCTAVRTAQAPAIKEFLAPF